MCKEGDRIVFLKDIYENTTGDHPMYHLASKDQEGTIKKKVKHNSYGTVAPDWYSIFWDGWKQASFIAQINVDFKLKE